MESIWIEVDIDNQIPIYVNLKRNMNTNNTNLQRIANSLKIISVQNIPLIHIQPNMKDHKTKLK